MLKNRPYKIVFTGPESSGKSTMSALAAKHYNTQSLNEYSRTFLNNLNRPYLPKDLISIAEGQLQSEKEFIQQYSKKSFLFFDTSLLVIKVWSIFKYGFYDIKLEKILTQNLPDFYFLCDWQIPWEYDPLRETPNDRDALYAIYKRELTELEIPFMEIYGTEIERLAQVILVIEGLNK